jgi:hypothetical protein
MENLMLELYAIYPDEEDITSDPISIKIDKGASAVLAFRTEAGAQDYAASHLSGWKTHVGSLTIGAIETAMADSMEQLGVQLYLKICD